MSRLVILLVAILASVTPAEAHAAKPNSMKGGSASVAHPSLDRPMRCISPGSLQPKDEGLSRGQHTALVLGGLSVLAVAFVLLKSRARAARISSERRSAS
jgi:hypothetical protein